MSIARTIGMWKGRSLVLGVGLWLAAPGARAMDEEAEQILRRHFSQVPPVAPLHVKSEVSWADLPSTGVAEEWYSDLLRYSISMDFPSIGEIELGCDGETVWESSSFGVEVREGASAEEALRRAAHVWGAPWQSMYVSAADLGAETIDGEPCRKLEMRPRSLGLSGEGRAAEAAAHGGQAGPSGERSNDTWWLSEETGLLRRVRSIGAGEGGEPVEVVLDLLDWRACHGGMHPYLRHTTISGFTMVVEVKEVLRPESMDPSRFALREEVAEKIAEQRSSEPTPAGVVEIIELAEQPIASIRVTCKFTDVQKTLAVLLPEAMRCVVAQGAMLVGPPLVRYYNFGDELDLEAAMPVREPITPEGRVKAETLPACKAAVIWHVGPYHELGVTHDKMAAYLEEHGLERAAAPWEEYWTDPGMEPDPAKWRTRVVYPIR